MGFTKGMQKKGGRIKGTPNKASQSMRELIEKHEKGTPGPVALWLAGREAMAVGMASGESGMVSAGLGAMGRSLQFAYQTLKAVELTGEVKQDLTLIIEEAPIPASDE